MLEFESLTSIGRSILIEVGNAANTGPGRVALMFGAGIVGFMLYWRFIRGDW
jgi:hypothetical protein